MPTVKIGQQEFELSPLKLKHLRKISKQIEETGISPRTASFNDLDKWLPFIGDSIKANKPDFDFSLLDEMTLQEFSEIWKSLLAVSGFSIVAKGEAVPTRVLTTNESTGDSRSATDGPTPTSVN